MTVLVIFTLIISNSETLPLQHVSLIRYTVHFQNNEIRVLVDSKSGVNVITPGSASDLGLFIRKINVSAQKIARSLLETYGIVTVTFSV